MNDTNEKETILEIDDILRYFEDFLHGEDGNKITHARKLLSQLKSSELLKPTPEARFAEIVEGLKIGTRKDYPNSDFYVKGNDTYFEYDKKIKHLWCDYENVWRIFEKEYGIKYDEIQAFIKVQVAKRLNIKDITPASSFWLSAAMVAKHLNIKDVTSEKNY